MTLSSHRRHLLEGGVDVWFMVAIRTHKLIMQTRWDKTVTAHWTSSSFDEMRVEQKHKAETETTTAINQFDDLTHS